MEFAEEATCFLQDGSFGLSAQLQSIIWQLKLMLYITTCAIYDNSTGIHFLLQYAFWPLDATKTNTLGF